MKIRLTGTPALSKPKDLFTLLSILRPTAFRFFKEFGTRYCDPKPSFYMKGVDYDGSSYIREVSMLYKFANMSYF